MELFRAPGLLDVLILLLNCGVGNQQTRPAPISQLPPTEKVTDSVGVGGNKQAEMAKDRYSTSSTITTRRTRTTLKFMSFVLECESFPYFCMKTFATGPVCARTSYYRYRTFPNYCFVQYVNCMQRHQVWEILTMYECHKLHGVKSSHKMFYNNYDDDSWLDADYVPDDI